MNTRAVPAVAGGGRTRGRLPLTGINRIVAVACTAALCAITPARASDLWCDGTLANLWVNKHGTVLVLPSWRSDYVQVCNVNEANAAGVTPSTCLSWLALMRSALQRNAQTTMYYSGVAAATCAAMPIYEAAPTPYYVMLKN